MSGDYYEIEVRDDDDEFVEFDTADTIDEALVVAKRFLEKYKWKQTYQFFVQIADESSGGT